MNTAAVIGTGQMGPGIALTLARGGLQVTILGRTAESAQAGHKAALAAIDQLAKNALLTGSEQIAGRIRATHDADSVLPDVDLVIESAPENMAFKQELFARLDAICRPDAVLTSNTSGLSITGIAERCTRPERVVTTHFWNPPHLIPFVEIVRGERTSPEVAERVRQLLKRCGKTPAVLKKDAPGQLGNRLQFALMREAAHIIAEGIADAEDVDSALKNAIGIRLPEYGLLEHMDAVGLDMVHSIAEYVIPHLNKAGEAPELLREMVARGELGAKAGRGFHDWSERDLAAVRRRRDEFVMSVLRRRAADQSSESTDRSASTSAP